MGQVVVITGAGGGLGSVFAVELAKDGKLIAVLDSAVMWWTKIPWNRPAGR